MLDAAELTGRKGAGDACAAAGSTMVDGETIGPCTVQICTRHVERELE